jgi:hypothetical protein
MLYREIIAVCSEIHTKHKCTLWAEYKTILRSAHTACIYVFCVYLRTNGYYFPISSSGSTACWYLQLNPLSVSFVTTVVIRLEVWRQ